MRARPIREDRGRIWSQNRLGLRSEFETKFVRPYSFGLKARLRPYIWLWMLRIKFKPTIQFCRQGWSIKVEASQYTRLMQSWGQNCGDHEADIEFYWVVLNTLWFSSWQQNQLAAFTHDFIPIPNTKILFPVERDIGISYCRLLLHDTMLNDDNFKSGTAALGPNHIDKLQNTFFFIVLDQWMNLQQLSTTNNNQSIPISYSLLLAPYEKHFSRYMQQTDCNYQRNSISVSCWLQTPTIIEHCFYLKFFQHWRVYNCIYTWWRFIMSISTFIVSCYTVSVLLLLLP